MVKRVIETLLIRKPEIAGEVKDRGVPAFGNFIPEQLQLPSRREPRKDIVRNIARRLKESAIERTLYFSHEIGNASQIHVHFPSAEHFTDVPFTTEHWKRYGNMESETSRIAFMLDTYPTRAFPESFRSIVKEASSSENPLTAWGRARSKIEHTSKETYQQILSKMVEGKEVDPLALSNGYDNAYQSTPIFYTTSPEVTENERTLWGRSVSQIVSELQSGNFENIGNFLNLYAYIKDPVTPVISTLGKQTRIFRELFQKASAQLNQLGINDLRDMRGQTLVTQLALESSFLSLPIARDIFYVRRDASHHELPYVPVTLETLPRGEYTDPRTVLPRLDELIKDTRESGRALITPIAVSYFQAPGDQPKMFIVDGNNRSTATMLVKYLDWLQYDITKADDLNSIYKFTETYQLHPGWERELLLTVRSLSEDRRAGLIQEKETLQKLAKAVVPALVVQEPNFHTVAVELSEGRDTITLLQPMHQAIYNQADIAMAIPPKKQTHGRTEGNYFQMEAPTRRGRIKIVYV